MEKKNPYIKKRAKYELTLLKCGMYELECYVFDKNSSRHALFIKNIETNSYHIGGDFLSYEWNAKEIKEELLPVIDEVIERKWGDEILGNNFTIMSVIINPKKTYFTSNNDLGEGRKEAHQDENKQLDTSMFREIILKWLEFVESQEKLQ